MLPVQRREKILELIKEDGHAKVLQLAKIFKVTEVTIRQDLEKLEKEGFVESLKSGLTYPSISDIVVKRAMIEAADEVYLVADSSKIGKNAFASLGALSLIDFLITDSKINERDKDLFNENDIKLVKAI